MPHFQPLRSNLVVHPFEQPEMSKSGLLHLPDRTKRRINQGIVVAKGPLASDEIDIADHVMFSGYSGDKVSFEDGGVFIVIPEEDITLIILESTIQLMDTETLKGELEARRGEMKLKYPQHEGLVDEMFDSLKDRIDMFSMHRGFEW